MPELIPPTVRLHAAWLEARDDWGPGVHEDGFGVEPSDEMESPAGFAAWVARLHAESNPADLRARCTYRWIIEGDQVLGAIALRHEPNDFGHIGYGIRPSRRRRGLATWALGQMLDEARSLGLDRVLNVCVADNVASARTIERQGGVLEDVQETEHGAVRRYWINLQGELEPAGPSPASPAALDQGPHVDQHLIRKNTLRGSRSAPVTPGASALRSAEFVPQRPLQKDHLVTLRPRGWRPRSQESAHAILWC